MGGWHRSLFLQDAVALEHATELASVPGAVVAKADVLKIIVSLASFVR